ncbi:MAG: nickel-dependent lactate racemase [Anaerovorax sp.]|nr:nickel-dependent lactate racemase [Anaerovorax sp.]
MAILSLKYGKGYKELPLNLFEDYEILENKMISKKSAKEIIQDALNNPIGSPRLSQIVKKGERICIVISDISRYYQRMDLFLPEIVKELNSAGILEEDISFLCATGAHAAQTEEEHGLLLGEELKKQFRVVDHDCHNKEDLVTLGVTRNGTEVVVNRRAVECDRLILTGGITYHDMAGYGGGRKSILPGIAGYDSVAANHSRVFGQNVGSGLNPACRMGNLEENPMHEDMIDACTMIKPDFLFNVILDSKGNYYKAVAGDAQEAFLMGTKYLDEVGAVFIEEKADVVIAGCGGYPKDLDLYQASKAFSASIEAVKDNGTVLVIAQCANNMGTQESVSIITDFEDNLQRETFLRKDFLPEAFSGYLLCELAKKYNLIMVSDYEPKSELDQCGIQLFREVSEAICYIEKTVNKKGRQIYILPSAMSVLPKLK